MPKITAPTIAEHVRNQEQAILDAAAELFARQGVADTEMADIAHAVGLARPSLYRYFPDKDHILLAWFDREMAPAIARSREIVAGPGSVEERLSSWLDFQLDYVTHPDHQLVPRLGQEVGATSVAVQQAIAADHARLYATLRVLVEEALEVQATRRDPEVLVALLSAPGPGRRAERRRRHRSRGRAARARRCRGRCWSGPRGLRRWLAGLRRMAGRPQAGGRLATRMKAMPRPNHRNPAMAQAARYSGRAMAITHMMMAMTMSSMPPHR